MKKSVLIFAFLLVLMFGVVSAQYSSGYGYGGFYLDDYINGDFISYAILFVLFFWLLLVILSRVPMFKGADGSKKQAVIGALLFSTGITYWTYRSNWNLDNLIYRFGFSEGLTSLLLVLVLLIVLFLIVKKVGFYGLFLASGAGLIAISFTDLVYDTTSVFIIGAVLFVIGLWLWNRKRKGEQLPASSSPGQNINVNVNTSSGLGQRMDGLSDRVKREREAAESQMDLQNQQDQRQKEEEDYRIQKESKKNDKERLLQEFNERKKQEELRRYEESQGRKVEKERELQEFKERKKQEELVRYEEKQRRKAENEQIKKQEKEEKKRVKAEEEARDKELKEQKDLRSKELSKFKDMYKRLNSELVKQENLVAKGDSNAPDKIRELRVEMDNVARSMESFS